MYNTAQHSANRTMYENGCESSSSLLYKSFFWFDGAIVLALVIMSSSSATKCRYQVLKM